MMAISPTTSPDRLRWVVVGLALIAPWFLLAYMDRLLRRSRTH
jgi:hypothetical protein